MVTTNKRVATTANVLFLAAALLTLAGLLFAIPTILKTDAAVSDAYKKCNRYYAEQLEQYGLRTRLTVTLDNYTYDLIHNYTGYYNASKD